MKTRIAGIATVVALLGTIIGYGVWQIHDDNNPTAVFTVCPTFGTGVVDLSRDLVLSRDGQSPETSSYCVTPSPAMWTAIAELTQSPQ